MKRGLFPDNTRYCYNIRIIKETVNNSFFFLFVLGKQIYTAVPQLKAHKNDVKQCLGQALQNRRKYQNDLKMGKRKAKNGYVVTVDSLFYFLAFCFSIN